MSARVAMLLPLVLLACRSKSNPTPNLGGSTGDSATNPGNGEGGGNGDQWFDSLSCVYDKEPTSFTGDLAWVRLLSPESGSFSYDLEGARVTHMEGEIDWESSTLVSTASYLEGYWMTESRSTVLFDRDASGDWTGTEDHVSVDRDGVESSRSYQVEREGCTIRHDWSDEEAGQEFWSEATFVSATERDWSSALEYPNGDGWSFDIEGVDTADWVTMNDWSTDDPSTARGPERSGSCENDPDGWSYCESVTLFDEAGVEESLFTTALNGDTESDWTSDWDGDGAANSWGINLQNWEGSGSQEWTHLVGEEEVSCTGEWDTSGVGVWTCEDGTSGTYDPADIPDEG